MSGIFSSDVIIPGVVATLIGGFIAWLYKAITGRTFNNFKSKIIRTLNRKPPAKLAQESQKRLNDIQLKLDNIKLSDHPFVLLGAIYLDISIDPVLTKTLGKEEWVNINPTRFSLGGSAIAVGRSLYSNQKQKSYLFSAIGRSRKTITPEIRHLISDEEWIINDNITLFSEGETASTVLLTQKENEYTTMFTHIGVLSQLTWESIKEDLHKIINKGGVLYISGFLKTGLHINIKKELKEIREICNNTIICIDHGRIMPELEKSTSIELLQEAFKLNLIDIYICTFNEILSFYNYAKKNKIAKSTIKKREKILKNIAKKGDLPEITFVRGLGFSQQIEAYAIISTDVYPINITDYKEIIDTAVGPKSTFNATVLHHLVNNQYDGDIN